MTIIRKRGLKWQVQIRRKGHPTLIRSFTLKGDAAQWVREQEVRLDQSGVFGLPDYTKSELHTVISAVAASKLDAQLATIINERQFLLLTKADKVVNKWPDA